MNNTLILGYVLLCPFLSSNTIEDNTGCCVYIIQRRLDQLHSSVTSRTVYYMDKCI